MADTNRNGSRLDADVYCVRCGARLRRGLVAGGRRACCLNATPIAGVCPTHGPGRPTSCDADARGDGRRV